MAGNSGVFICCRQYERECLNALRLLKPSETYSRVKRDHTYGGLKIFFKDSLTVRSILREQHLWISGKKFSIHSLTTTLIVHTELSEFPRDFEKVLRNGIQHIGPTLKVSRHLLFDDIPDSYTGDWKIVLDVPEIEDLDVFRQHGLPNNMTLDLPGFGCGFRVSFCCSFCDQDGHTLRSCPVIGNVRNTPETRAATQSSNINSNAGVREATHIPSSSQRDSELKKNNEEKKPMILPNHIKTWARITGEEKVRQEFISHFNIPVTISQKESEQDPYGSPLKKQSSLDEDSDSDGNEYKPSLEYAPKSGNQDDAGQVPTSSRPDGIIESAKSELPSTDDNLSDANQNSPHAAATGHRTPRRRKQTRSTRIEIPEGIKILISQNSGVLDEERLEAFFNHVKKKSCPCEVARQYTDDVQGLKAQLQGIKNRYYNTPVIHSADEKYFMKWFENVLARFDRKPTPKTKK